ncbi:hypothetical protein P8452_56491 [Trifolium repens]|nr:hypothetical protein P8452_56491 [Trifolium repens]
MLVSLSHTLFLDSCLKPIVSSHCFLPHELFASVGLADTKLELEASNHQFYLFSRLPKLKSSSSSLKNAIGRSGEKRLNVCKL